MRENLLEAINKYHPKSLSSLRSRLYEADVQFEDEELTRLLRQLSSEGLISITQPDAIHRAFLDYCRDPSRSLWLYFVTTIAWAESGLVLSDSQNPAILIPRAVLGILLLSFAPGYAATKAVFVQLRFRFLERLLLTIFLSLVISIGIGTVLGSFLLFQAVLTTLLIGAATIVLALIGGYRECRVSPGRTKLSSGGGREDESSHARRLE